MAEPQFYDIVTSDGSVLRVVYEMSVGDLLVAGGIGLLLVFLVLKAIHDILWRR